MLKIHHINAATLCTPGGKLLLGKASPGYLVCHCVLVETHDGLVLIDTGLGLADIDRPDERLGKSTLASLGPRLDREETAAYQVERLGFKRKDVRHILLTHLDVDHAGGLTDFPEATVHLYAPEHALLNRPLSLQERGRYRPQQWTNHARFSPFHAAGESWQGFPCARQLPGLPDQILAIPLVGHTIGHAGFAIDTEDGWLVHAGDAYFHHTEMSDTPEQCPKTLQWFQKLVSWNRQLMEANRARLRQLELENSGDIRIVCAHDPTEFGRCAHTHHGGFNVLRNSR